MSYSITITTMLNGKYVCLICDARGMPNTTVLADHMRGRRHQRNVENFCTLDALDIRRQKLLMNNTVYILEDVEPPSFKCFACDTRLMNEGTVFNHIRSEKHVLAIEDIRADLLD